MSAGTSFSVAVSPGGSSVGRGGISRVRLGQLHCGSGGASFDVLTVSVVISGKLLGMMPSCSKASLHKNALVIFLDR